MGLFHVCGASALAQTGGTQQRNGLHLIALKVHKTIAEIESLLSKPKSKRMGCNRHPLFKFIPIDHVVIDTLHLFLRIADLLINLLIQDLRREDGIMQSKDLNPSQHVSIRAYATFLREVCKISFQWYTSKETHKLHW